MYIKAFTDYLLLEKKYSKHTVLAYKKDLESFKEFCREEFHNSDLRVVNYSEVRSWIVALSQNNISNRSIVIRHLHNQELSHNAIFPLS